MSVGFGFSAGDFLAALRLVSTVIDTLRDSSNVSGEYRSLLNELLHLETALLLMKRIELTETQYAEESALRQAAARCQEDIDNYWNSIQKYQLHLLGTTSRMKDGWMRIKFTLCKKDDLDKFRARIRAHTTSINLLATTAQINFARLQTTRDSSQRRRLLSAITNLTSVCMARLQTIINGISESVQQGVPSGLRNAPTRFEITDSSRPSAAGLSDRRFGKYSPFHLEFVRSADALRAVLKVNLHSSGCGPQMIDDGDFVITKDATQLDIDLDADWEAAFLPGDRLAMSMVFKNVESSENTCPGCGHDSSTVAAPAHWW